MAENLAELWEKATPVQTAKPAQPIAAQPDDLAALWEQATPIPEVPVSTGDALRRGVEKGATFGARDKIAAAAGQMGAAYQQQADLRAGVLPFPREEIEAYARSHPSKDQPFLRSRLGLEPLPMDFAEAMEAMKAERGNDTLEDVRRQALGEEEAKTAAAKGQHPWAYAGGNLAGGLLAAPGVGAAGNAARTVGARILSSGVTGAGFGAANALGESHAENTRDQAADALKGAALGALTGGVGQGLGESAKVLLRALPLQRAADALRRIGNEKAFKVIGGIKGDIRSALSGRGVTGGLDRVRQAGGDLRDLGVATPLATPQRALERIRQQEDAVGQALGHALPDLDQRLVGAGEASNPAFAVDLNAVASRVAREVVAPLRNSHVIERQRIADHVEAQLQEMLALPGNSNGTISFATAHAFRRAMDEPLYWQGKVPERHLTSNYVSEIRRAISDEIANKVHAASNAFGGTSRAAWQQLNRLYSALAIGERVATKGAESAAGNNSLGLREAMAASAALAAGGPLEAAKVAMEAKLLSKYGPGLQMAAAGAGERLLRAPERLVDPAVRAAIPYAIQTGSLAPATLALLAALRTKRPEQPQEEPANAP